VAVQAARVIDLRFMVLGLRETRSSEA